MRTTGIRGAWCASDWRLWLLSIIHSSDLHGVLSVVCCFFLPHGEFLVAVWTRERRQCWSRGAGKGDGRQTRLGVVTRVIRAFLYCRSFRSVSATPHVMILF